MSLRHSPVRTLIAVAAAYGVLGAWLVNAADRTPPDSLAIAAAERQVRETVQEGAPVGLTEATGRHLRAEFVAGLLASGTKAGWDRLLISNAIVVGDLDLTRADVPFYVELNRARFEGRVDLAHARFRRSFSLEASEFEQDASFEHVTVDGDLCLANARFARGLNASGASITCDLDAEGAMFADARSLAQFNGVVVGKRAYFVSASFAGDVDLIGAEVGGQLNMSNARFHRPEEARYLFHSMKVAGHALFRNAEFRSPADFRFCQFAGNLDAQGMTNLAGGATALAAEGRSSFHTDFSGATVRGGAYFAGSELRGTLSLAGASFGLLDLRLVRWPTAPRSVAIDGLRFSRIAFGQEPVTFDRVQTALLESSAYSPDVYAAVEHFFQSQGEAREANRVFHARSRLERRQQWDDGRYGQWAWSWLLRLTVGNGRAPGFALLWTSLFVGIGYVVFREPRRPGAPRKMEPRKPDQAPDVYNAFWYSLDLFTPAIDLEAAKAWKPRQESRFARQYLRLHRIVGWVVVPIGIAAIMGLLR